MTIRCSMLLTVAALLTAVSGSMGQASAHAQLTEATPAVNGTVAEPPKEVTLHFSERLEAGFSTIIVRSATGKRVDKADSKIEGADRTVLRATLQPLEAGIYIVEWRALTADTHRTEGAFIFRFGE